MTQLVLASQAYDSVVEVLHYGLRLETLNGRHGPATDYRSTRVKPGVRFLHQNLRQMDSSSGRDSKLWTQAYAPVTMHRTSPCTDTAFPLSSQGFERMSQECLDMTSLDDDAKFDLVGLLRRRCDACRH